MVTRTFLQRTLTATAIGVLLISPVKATDYWVDGLDGNDANDGLTKTTAKETIQDALDEPAVTAGDVINVLPAANYGGFTLGVAQSGVTIKAHGEVVIVTGYANLQLLTSIPGSPTRLEGITFQGTVRGILFNGCSDVVVERCRFLETVNSGIDVIGAPVSLIRIRECLFADSAIDGITMPSGGDLLAERCTFTRNTRGVAGNANARNSAFHDNDATSSGVFAYCNFSGGEAIPAVCSECRTDDPLFIDPDSQVYYVKTGSPLLDQGEDGGPIGAFGQGLHTSKDMSKDEPVQGPTPWAQWVDQNGDAPAPAGASTLVELNDNSELLLQETTTSAGIYSPVFDTGSDFTVIRSVDFGTFQDTERDAGLREIIDGVQNTPDREIRIRHSRTVNFSQVPFETAEGVEIDTIDKHVTFRTRARYVQIELVLRKDGD